jgi:hypothetical protein
MKDYFKAFGYSLIVGILANIMAGISIFPIVGLLHNRWIKIIPYNNAKEIYFWVGQIVETLVFIVVMYITLREKQWSKLKSLIAVVISVIILIVLGIIISII